MSKPAFGVASAKVRSGINAEVAISCKCEGQTLMGQNKFVDAEGCFRNCVIIYEQLHTDVRGIHADVALSWSCVGEALMGQHKFVDAEGCFRKCLAIYEQLGRRSDVSLVLCFLGDLFMRQSRFAEAEAMYQQALAIRLPLGRVRDIERTRGDVDKAQQAQRQRPSAAHRMCSAPSSF